MGANRIANRQYVRMVCIGSDPPLGLMWGIYRRGQPVVGCFAYDSKGLTGRPRLVLSNEAGWGLWLPNERVGGDCPPNTDDPADLAGSRVNYRISIVLRKCTVLVNIQEPADSKVHSGHLKHATVSGANV